MLRIFVVCPSFSPEAASIDSETTPSQVATKTTGHGNDAELSLPPSSCGVTTNTNEQPVPMSGNPQTSMGQLGAGQDEAVEAAPLVAQVPGDSITGHSYHGAGDKSLDSSSTFDIVFSGEPQEPSTPDRRDERHREGGEGALPSPGGNNNARVGMDVAQQGDGPKETEDTLPQQHGFGGEGDGENGGKNLAMRTNESREEPPTVVLSAAATVTATATTAPAATPTATLTTRRTPEGNKTDVFAGETTGTTTTSSAAAVDQRVAREVEESSGSLEGDSAHSRWSLPEARGIGGIGVAGGLHEQRAVWVGGMEDDSVGTADQATSSVESGGGGLGEAGGSPSRSRVESYDLQQGSVRKHGVSKTVAFSVFALVVRDGKRRSFGRVRSLSGQSGFVCRP